MGRRFGKWELGLVVEVMWLMLMYRDIGPSYIISQNYDKLSLKELEPRSNWLQICHEKELYI